MAKKKRRSTRPSSRPGASPAAESAALAASTEPAPGEPGGSAVSGSVAAPPKNERPLEEYLRRTMRSPREHVTFGDLLELERVGVLDTIAFDG